ncbi:probable dolichyl pyrophosphate Man9GlcNAc2 alpha-1,3-glucosyltransferase [Condylostylus longicornis]|uniref:probable dolichyl pyrophosphate Man9GlcNAc2 alpha-1,3-glucosyltransferase n=1 Tax=Condylostylus longicornis TaxID=2530218 RepID=UPI00244DE243|nr:probable dolichyl pyrophosphate Man9GlcNAc2 alpha-1,3-glucosyltransferase [Condylostylus longicornis]
MKKTRSVRSASISSDTSSDLKHSSSSTIITIILLGIALRATTSLYDFSGYKNPPMFGDYEAQRHWQEITINTPIEEWYVNTTKNDLLYWGLDYPPLTAYHSYILGKVAQKFNPAYVELNESRGFYSDEHKLFMRTSVLITDLLIFFPAAVLLIKSFKESPKSDFLGLVSLLYYPGLLLIDYGHFQYNNISLGLAIAAIVSILKDKDLLASVLFCLALNYKQMELYHSLPFFYYLFRKCFAFQNSWIPFRFMYFIKLANSVILTFALCWIPWLYSNDRLMSVLTRLFPFNRGIFEDKVSNFWCVLNIFVKVREMYNVEQNLYACLGATAISILPSMLTLFFYPSKQGFTYAVLNSSLGFFLFSYHVHEKSILLAVIPAIILINKEPQIVFWFLQTATFSMIPLIVKDNLLIAFLGLNILFESLFRILNVDNNKRKSERILKNLRILSLLGCVTLTILHIFGPVPDKLPHLYELLISSYCCVHFIFFLLYFTVKQFLIRNEN